MSTEERPAHPGGRDGQRGGSRGRGRGRGRGNIRPIAIREQNSLRTEDNEANVDAAVRRQPRPRPTHFICLPIGHHSELRTRVAAFQNALLQNEPTIPGLDSKILISPRRMHITLGVMNLIDSSQAIASHAYVTSSRVPASYQTEVTPEAKTVQAAVQLLQALRPSIIEKLTGHDLLVGLDIMDIMRPDRGDLTKAHVMWAGPSYEDIQAQHLKRVCEFISNEFKKAGFVVDEKRPLKLHCTVINTSYRGPVRRPFSYADIISSRAFQSIEKLSETNPNMVYAARPVRGRKAIAVDLGTWRVDEIQICKMGSWGPEGEYVSVGNISLK